MGYYIGQGYYEGDRQHQLDVEVPQRPSNIYDWNGSAWVVNATRQVAALRDGADESERVECKLDAPILNLLNQTRAEWQAWAGSNFPSLTAPEKNRLGTLFWVVAIGVRRVMRNG